MHKSAHIVLVWSVPQKGIVTLEACTARENYKIEALYLDINLFSLAHWTYPKRIELSTSEVTHSIAEVPFTIRIS